MSVVSPEPGLLPGLYSPGGSRPAGLLLCLLACLLSACGESNTAQPGRSEAADTAPVPAAQRILVTGVTGRQGGSVARALLAARYRVRGLSRNPESERADTMTALGVEVVKGDFDDRASLDAAMQDVHGVFAMTDFWEHGYEAEVRHGQNIVDAAGRAGVRHLVFSSVANADQEYVREEIQAGKLRTPFSISTHLQQISVRDIGRFAALAFDHPGEWTGRSLDIAGEEYSVAEVVRIFSRITAGPVEYVRIPWDVYEELQGPEMTGMDRWIENTGYSANINRVRSYLPDMLTLEEYLYRAGW